MATIVDVLNERYDEQIKAVEMHLSAGRAESFDDYKYMCGQIRGLTVARNLMVDLSREMEENYD